ncbi:kinase-like domain-containing protein [Mycena latifolia]|nr:kinase-like domain-containing protein [Mycena latifolia]
MDFVSTALSVVPVPGLSAAFKLLGYLYSSIQQVQTCKAQFTTLIYVTAGSLKALNERCLANKIAYGTMSVLPDLESLLDEINRFVAKRLSQSFMKTLCGTQSTMDKIEGFHLRINAVFQVFQISSILREQDWQAKQDAAREEDRRRLEAVLDTLPRNDARLMQALQVNQENMSAMMVFLMRQMKTSSQSGPEYNFYSQSLRRLSIVSGQRLDIEDWMVTVYEVDREEKIGSGGFGDVYRGIWHKTEVAIKVVRTGGVVPSSQAVLREIKLWLTLRHPNILPFLGANHLDSEPFIVMPYLQHGNAHEFLQRYPEQNPLSILTDAARGLLYLHSKDIVHGDLKAANILIDNAGTGVLCDFGLARVKADMSSRTAQRDIATLGPGSRNWMSPELFRGSPPRRPSDIYAFGMTIYELFSREVPLGHIFPQDLRSLVVDEDLRPDILGSDDKPVMPPDAWAVAVKAWAKNPQERPTAAVLCDMLVQLQGASKAVLLLPQTSTLRDYNSHGETLQLAAPSLNCDCDECRNNQNPAQPQESAGSPSPVSDRSSNTSTTANINYVSPEPQQLSASESPTSDRSSSTSKKKPRWRQKLFWRKRPSPTGLEQPEAIIQSCDPDTFQIISAKLKVRGSINCTSGCRSVAFSPSGLYLASGSVLGTIQIWDIQTNKLVCQRQTHEDAILAIAFSPDGLQVAVAAEDVQGIWGPWEDASQQAQGLTWAPTLGGWVDLQNWTTERQSLEHMRGSLNQMRFSRDGRMMAVVYGRYISIVYNTNVSS